MDEYAPAPEHRPLGKHDLDGAEERHGVFDHSDGRLVIDPEEAKIEVRPASFARFGKAADERGSMAKRWRVG